MTFPAPADDWPRCLKLWTAQVNRRALLRWPVYCLPDNGALRLEHDAFSYLALTMFMGFGGILLGAGVLHFDDVLLKILLAGPLVAIAVITLFSLGSFMRRNDGAYIRFLPGGNTAKLRCRFDGVDHMFSIDLSNTRIVLEKRGGPAIRIFERYRIVDQFILYFVRGDDRIEITRVDWQSLSGLYPVLLQLESALGAGRIEDTRAPRIERGEAKPIVLSAIASPTWERRKLHATDDFQFDLRPPRANVSLFFVPPLAFLSFLTIQQFNADHVHEGIGLSIVSVMLAMLWIWMIRSDPPNTITFNPRQQVCVIHGRKGVVRRLAFHDICCVQLCRGGTDAESEFVELHLVLNADNSQISLTAAFGMEPHVEMRAMAEIIGERTGIKVIDST